MKIEVALYGSIARKAGGRHLKVLSMELPQGARIRDILDKFNLKPEEIGLVFINAVLHDLPGPHLSLEDEVHDGDHVGIFAEDYVWPYHYRGGAPMSPKLKEYVSTHEYLRHRPKDLA